jgi:hypothetical protein
MRTRTNFDFDSKSNLKKLLVTLSKLGEKSHQKPLNHEC